MSRSSIPNSTAAPPSDSRGALRLHDAVAPAERLSTAPSASHAHSPWNNLKRITPTLLIVALLAGLAFWGHSTDWTLPKLSALFGGGEIAEEEWCKAHNVAEAECIECNSTLLPPEQDFGWCKIHGVAQCPYEHPQVAQLKETPTITPADTERAARALALRPRAENNSRCKLHLRRIQFASIEALDKAGVDIAVVTQRPIIEAVTAPGEVTYDQTRTAHLASRVTGTVSVVFKQVGDRVQSGDLLTLVDSAEVGRGKSDLLQAISQFRLKKTNVARLTPLFENGSVPERNLREADSALEQAEIQMLSAQQHLINLGLDVDVALLEGLDAAELSRRVSLLGIPADALPSAQGKAPTSNLFPLRAPLDGVVIARHVVAGEV
ncbi:MAG TPA: efflux RND transporter periplasmic adaptor subunit, partial [Pirellulales bacterium]